MELMSVPQALPGSCAKCGSATRDWFLDTDLYYEFHGAVYICSDCLAEMASLAGYARPEKVERMNIELNEALRSIEELTIQVEGLEQAVDGLRLSRSTSRDVTLPVATLSVPLDTEGASVSAPQLGEGTGIFTEPLHDEGVAIVPDDAGSDTGIFSLGI